MLVEQVEPYLVGAVSSRANRPGATATCASGQVRDRTGPDRRARSAREATSSHTRSSEPEPPGHDPPLTRAQPLPGRPVRRPGWVVGLGGRAGVHGDRARQVQQQSGSRGIEGHHRQPSSDASWSLEGPDPATRSTVDRTAGPVHAAFPAALTLRFVAENKLVTWPKNSSPLPSGNKGRHARFLPATGRRPNPHSCAIPSRGHPHLSGDHPGVAERRSSPCPDPCSPWPVSMRVPAPVAADRSSPP